MLLSKKLEKKNKGDALNLSAEVFRKQGSEKDDSHSENLEIKHSFDAQMSKAQSKPSKFSATMRENLKVLENLDGSRTDIVVPGNLLNPAHRRRSSQFEVRENGPKEPHHVVFSGIKDTSRDESKLLKHTPATVSESIGFIPGPKSGSVGSVKSITDVGNRRKSFLSMFRRKSEQLSELELTASQLKLVDEILSPERTYERRSTLPHHDKVKLKNKLLDLVSRVAAKKGLHGTKDPTAVIFATMLVPFIFILT